MFFINSIDQLDIVIHLLLYIIRYPKKYPKIDSTSLALRIKSLECTLIMIIRHVVFSHFWSPALFERLCDFEILKTPLIQLNHWVKLKLQILNYKLASVLIFYHLLKVRRLETIYGFFFISIPKLYQVCINVYIQM